MQSSLQLLLLNIIMFPDTLSELSFVMLPIHGVPIGHALVVLMTAQLQVEILCPFWSWDQRNQSRGMNGNILTHVEGHRNSIMSGSYLSMGVGKPFPFFTFIFYCLLKFKECMEHQ